uniref:Putative secreted protein n=1 Tax=Anopheles darlingi TaxID=43151 RepID=A0A2M4D9L1_ANODA
MLRGERLVLSKISLSCCCCCCVGSPWPSRRRLHRLSIRMALWPWWWWRHCRRLPRLGFRTFCPPGLPERERERESERESAQNSWENNEMTY